MVFKQAFSGYMAALVQENQHLPSHSLRVSKRGRSSPLAFSSLGAMQLGTMENN